MNSFGIRLSNYRGGLNSQRGIGETIKEISFVKLLDSKARFSKVVIDSAFEPLLSLILKALHLPHSQSFGSYSINCRKHLLYMTRTRNNSIPLFKSYTMIRAQLVSQLICVQLLLIG